MIGSEVPILHIIQYPIFIYGKMACCPDIINPVLHFGIQFEGVVGAGCTVRRCLCSNVGVI